MTFLLIRIKGDSGGPLFYYNQNSDPVQVGVVSFGPRECAQEGFAAVYARISYALPWIRTVACERFFSTHTPLCGDYIPGGLVGPALCDDETETQFQVIVRTDDNAGGFSWELQDTQSSEVVFSDDDFSERETRLYEGCLPKDVDCWSLKMTDTMTDSGFCCDGPGEDGKCCDGWKAGFGIVFGDVTEIDFDNPVFEESTISYTLCQNDAIPKKNEENVCADVNINLLPGDAPEELSVFLLGDSFEILVDPSKYDLNEGEYTIESCLEGCLRFAIFDSTGDGTSPPGGVTITYDGAQVDADLSNIGSGILVEFGEGCPDASLSLGSACQDFEIVLTTDDKPEETSIFILAGDEYEVVLARKNDLLAETNYRYSSCLTGCVMIGIFDTNGDGLQSAGFVSASYGRDSLDSISDFGRGQMFRLGEACSDIGMPGTSISRLAEHDS